MYFVLILAAGGGKNRYFINGEAIIYDNSDNIVINGKLETILRNYHLLSEDEELSKTEK